jgi:arylsulfatase A-like enzyme
LGIDWPSKADPNKITSNQHAIDFTKPFAKGPVDFGFDYFYGINASLDMTPYTFLRNNKAVIVPTQMVGRKTFGANGLGAPGIKPTDFLPAFTKEAVSYIESQDTKKPFFLYLPLNAPHTPIAPSKHFSSNDGLKGKLRTYADFCVEVDDTVGQVLAALEKKGLSDNTLIIFTSDNGCAYYIGVDEFEKAGHFPSAIYTGYKGGTYDGGHRVPFLVRWPKTIKPGTKNEQTICLTDLMATCAEIIGKPYPENAGEDSLSFLSAMHGKPIDRTRREAIVHHDIDGNFALRKGKWKLLVKATPGIGAPPPAHAKSQPDGHLYDVESDPGEKKNVASEHPEVVKELKALLEKYKRDDRSVQR